MLSFELRQSSTQDPPDELEIYCDRVGLESLMAQLQLLRDNRTDHVHLLAERWGGTHLSNSPQGDGNAPVRQVRILLRSDGHAT